MTRQPDPIEAAGPPRGVPETAPRRRSGSRPILLLLLIPFVALLYPPFYAALEPRLAGLPFFIWYQFLWIIITVVITALVYALDRGATRADP